MPTNLTRERGTTMRGNSTGIVAQPLGSIWMRYLSTYHRVILVCISPRLKISLRTKHLYDNYVCVTAAKMRLQFTTPVLYLECRSAEVVVRRDIGQCTVVFSRSGVQG